MSEEWRAVPGFEGLYEVSDLGRVRSLDRLCPVVSRKGKRWFRRYRGRVLSPGPHVGGYQTLHLHNEGRSRCTVVHIVVAEAFLGPRPPGHHVCHYDGDTQNSAAANLRYDTPKGNAADRHRHGTAPLGEKSACAVLTTDDVLAIRQAIGVPQEVLAQRYGCTFSNISAIQLRKSWKHV